MGKLSSLIGGNKHGVSISIDESEGPKKYGWMNQTSKTGRGSIVNMAAKNTFEFPVFVSSSVPLEYATAATTLLEQIYTSFLQTAISSQPYVSEKSVKVGNTFEKFKSNTSKYLEFAETFYQKDAYQATYIRPDGVVVEFELVTVEDSDARIINESVEHVPLSEFDHFFQEESSEVSFSTKLNDDDTIKFSGNPISMVTGVEDVILKAKQIQNYKKDHAVEIDGKITEIAKKNMELEKLRKDLDHYDSSEADKRKKTSLEVKKLESEVQDLTDRLNRDISKYRKDMMAKAPEVLDESKLSKINTMKPYMMKVQVVVRNDDGSQTPMEQIIGVKCHCRLIDAATLPDVASFPLKEMNQAARKAKWKAGELKFFKDFVFATKEKKQTAIDNLDPSRAWYRRLYELAHRKGDAIAARATSTDTEGTLNFIMKTEEYGLIPNASIVITQNDANNIKASTGIDLLSGRVAAKFCDELYLISFMVIDQDAESVKLLIPDQSKTFEIHSMGSLNKTMSELDTAGAKTRQMFKLMG